MEENDIYSISAINNLIDKKISYCDDFKKIKIRGEITNFNGSYNSGHYYFSLKDKNSSISCVMFKLSTKSLDFEPKNGVDVVASGEVSFYKVRGNLQFRVRKMQEAGLGDLYIAFEKLKKKLDKEGLFKDKKAIPQYPKKIGVITSASGKAVKDIVNNIEKRWPAEIIVWNTTVQGANSTRSITKNIALANKTDVDVIIVGRGGGSTQDLWDFNKEEVVRSIANSKKPVITAIGHSTDKTLSDLASDKVAATPTKAAELVSPNLINDFKNWNQQNKIIAILIICAILILTLNSLISFSSTDSYSPGDSATSNHVSYSYDSYPSHYGGVDTSPDTIAKNDPDSYYDYYEYGDNPDVDDYLESEGYD